MTKSFTVDFICVFDMKVYPFDSQQCPVIFIMKGNSGHFVELVQGTVSYKGPENVMQYIVQDVCFIDSVTPTADKTETH